jgi:hypothetical protein
MQTIFLAKISGVNEVQTTGAIFFVQITHHE